ncbi:MAG: DMT family transporter [Victivallaceae bacterium]
MNPVASGWLLPILASAIALGFYDLCKKHAVRDNSVMPVLFFATVSGTIFFLFAAVISGKVSAIASCGIFHWWLIMFKSLLVSSSWICAYYAMRELPISIATPIRASSPLWTFIGSLFLYNEFPSWLQGLGMVSIFAGYYLFSVMGKLEGISFRHHRGIHLIILATLSGSISALYDKYLLGVIRIPHDTVQFWFSVDLVLVLWLAWWVRRKLFRDGRKFVWRWSIPLTGILLILADWLYFYAVSLPETRISILSLVRRCSCLVTFGVGVYYFRDLNIRGKAVAMILILIGLILFTISR